MMRRFTNPHKIEIYIFRPQRHTGTCNLPENWSKIHIFGRSICAFFAQPSFSRKPSLIVDERDPVVPVDEPLLLLLQYCYVYHTTGSVFAVQTKLRQPKLKKITHKKWSSHYGSCTSLRVKNKNSSKQKQQQTKATQFRYILSPPPPHTPCVRDLIY